MTHKNRDAEASNLEHPLGIADQPIVTSESDHVDNSSDPTLRRRRARALGEDGIERDHTGSDVNVDPDGAAGIDMGYGGEGTDVSSRK